MTGDPHDGTFVPREIADTEAAELRKRRASGERLGYEDSRALEAWNGRQLDTRTWFDKGPVRAAIRGILTGLAWRGRRAIRAERRGEELCQRLVGMHLDEAAQTVLAEGFQVREVSVRNRIQTLTADSRSDRVTVFGDAEDKVTRATYG